MTFKICHHQICSNLHPLQVENCDRNARLAVNKDFNDKSRVEKIKHVCNIGCVDIVWFTVTSDVRRDKHLFLIILLHLIKPIAHVG